MNNELKVVQTEAWGEFIADTKHAKKVVFNRPVQPQETDEAAVAAVEHVFGDNIPWHIKWKMYGTQGLILCWSEDDEERLIHPKYNHLGETTAIWQMAEEKDILRWDAAPPGVGHQTFRIDRKDDDGIWGVCLEDTIWVPE